MHKDIYAYMKLSKGSSVEGSARQTAVRISLFTGRCNKNGKVRSMRQGCYIRTQCISLQQKDKQSLEAQHQKS